MVMHVREELVFFMHVDGGREGGPPATSCCFGCCAQLEDLALKVCCNFEFKVSFGLDSMGT